MSSLYLYNVVARHGRVHGEQVLSASEPTNLLAGPGRAEPVPATKTFPTLLFLFFFAFTTFAFFVNLRGNISFIFIYLGSSFPNRHPHRLSSSVFTVSIAAAAASPSFLRSSAPPLRSSTFRILSSFLAGASASASSSCSSLPRGRTACLPACLRACRPCSRLSSLLGRSRAVSLAAPPVRRVLYLSLASLH